MARRMLVVRNPRAGSFISQNSFLEAAGVIFKSDYNVYVYSTQCRGDATRIVAEEGEGYDCIVAFGGDGTLNEVINGLMRLQKRPVLGYIPAGTTNDFAAGLGLSRIPVKAAATVLEGTVQAAGTHVPRVAVCPDLASALSRLEEDSRDYERTVKLAMDNVRAVDNLPVYLNGMRETFWWPKVLTVAAIGSERGWTDRERDFLEGEGFALLRMGSRVLRTETAATVAASLVLAAMGNLN